MKARNPSTGNLETVYVKALDSMPVGTEVDFDGQTSDIPTGWEEVDNVLYDDTTGATGNITLNYSINNYNTFEIYFSAPDSYVGVAKFYVVSGATYAIDKNRIDSSTVNIYQEKVQISGTSLTKLTNRTYTATSGTISDDNPITIKKIVGYK